MSQEIMLQARLIDTDSWTAKPCDHNWR